MLLDRLMKRSSDSVLQISLRDPALRDLWGIGTMTAAGVRINENNALKISAVLACVKVISETIATMPLITYQRQTGGGKKRATDHPNYVLLKDRPNELQTSNEFRQMQQAFLLTWGNAFTWIEQNGGGRILNLWPLRPDRIRINVRPGPRIWYYWTNDDGDEIQFSQEEIMHQRGLGGDVYCGYSVISMVRESLGLCQASQEYRARFFRNDARPGGILKHPGQLSGQAHDNLRESMRQQFGGTNRRGFAILEEGMDWKDVGVPPNDAQFIEGWEAGREEIAGVFRVPPYKIGIMKPGTVSHSSVEQSNLDFWIGCIMSWCDNWEKRILMSLFTPAEQQVYFAEFLADSILRADSKTRAETLQIWRQNGVLSADEWRELENMNPLPDGSGKDYWIPSNMLIVGEPRPQPAGAGAAFPAARYIDIADGSSQILPATNGHAHE